MGARHGADDSTFGAAVGLDGETSTRTRSPCIDEPTACGGNENVAGQASLEARIDRVASGSRAEAVAVHGETTDQQVASLGCVWDGVAFAFNMQQFALAD